MGGEEKSKAERRRCEDEAICTANEKSGQKIHEYPHVSTPALGAVLVASNIGAVARQEWQQQASRVDNIHFRNARRRKSCPRLHCVRPTHWEFMTMRQNDLQCLIDTGTQHVKPCLGRRNASFLLEAIDLQSPRQSGCRP